MLTGSLRATYAKLRPPQTRAPLQNGCDRTGKLASYIARIVGTAPENVAFAMELFFQQTASLVILQAPTSRASDRDGSSERTAYEITRGESGSYLCRRDATEERASTPASQRVPTHPALAALVEPDTFAPPGT